METKTRDRKQRKDKVLVIIARILGTGVFICTILLLLPLSLPRIMGYSTYNVVSGSMEPEIPVGSLILVKPVDCLELKENDVIAFYREDVVVCHRVLENNTFEGKLSTKGDANDTEDFGILTYADVIGIVENHYPVLGSIGAYVSTTSGKLLIFELLVVAALLHIVADRISK